MADPCRCNGCRLVERARDMRGYWADPLPEEEIRTPEPRRWIRHAVAVPTPIEPQWWDGTINATTIGVNNTVTYIVPEGANVSYSTMRFNGVTVATDQFAVDAPTVPPLGNRAAWWEPIGVGEQP